MELNDTILDGDALPVTGRDRFDRIERWLEAGRQRLRGSKNMMKQTTRGILGLALAVGMLSSLPANGQKPVREHADWQAQFRELLPLLGHRNWVLIVDSAYPLQNSSGIHTIETNAGELDVVKEVLNEIDHSIHVRPVVFLDAEFPFVPESDAPGVTQYRKDLEALLGSRAATRIPHEELLQKVNDVSRSYEVIVLKTNMAIPYSSVFLELNCKYWSDDAEARLRSAMKAAAQESK